MKNLKIENIFIWKIDDKLARLLARWHVNLKIWQVGMFIGLLARKNEMLAHRPRWQASHAYHVISQALSEAVSYPESSKVFKVLLK